MRIYNQMAENLVYETIIVCFPHTIQPDVGCVMTTELEAFFRSKSMYVAAQNKILITPEMCEEVGGEGSISRGNRDFRITDVCDFLGILPEKHRTLGRLPGRHSSRSVARSLDKISGDTVPGTRRGKECGRSRKDDLSRNKHGRAGGGARTGGPRSEKVSTLNQCRKRFPTFFFICMFVAWQGNTCG